MDSSAAILVALAAYLIGSISFARVMVRLVKPDTSLHRARIHKSDTGEEGTVSGIGASTASIALGPKYGYLVALLDMLKAFVPILALQSFFPGRPYGLVFSIFAIIGHNFPIYHRFNGGRGLSPMLGSLLVIEPVGMIAAMLAGTLIGILINQPHTALMIWLPLLALWSWLVRGDPALTFYSVLIMGLFISAEIPEIRLAMQFRKEGRMDEYNRMILDSAPQTRMMKRMADKLRFWETGKANSPGER